MVAIVPNRTEIKGKIVSVKPDKTRKDFHSIVLHLTRIMEANEELSLADFEVNTSITVLIAGSIMKENKLKKGRIILCAIRKTNKGEYFIIPDSIHIEMEK